MKLASIFIGLINIATMVVAADAFQQQPQESTMISRTLAEGDVKEHGLAYAFYHPENLIFIKNLVDTNLTFDWNEKTPESGFKVTITGTPKSVQAAENKLKMWVNSLIVLESQVPFSGPRWEYLKLVGKSEHLNKTSRLWMHMSQQKEKGPIDIYVITIPGNEEQARQMLEHLVRDYREEMITCEPENLDKMETDIGQKRQDLPMDSVRICLDRKISTFYVAGTNPQFAKWAAAIKDLVEKKSTAKEDTASKHYILVKNHRDVSFGDVASALRVKLSVRVERIRKSEAHPGYLEVPFPTSSYVERAVALKNLIIDRYGSEISLPILDPRNPAHIKGIMGSQVPEKEIHKNEQVNDLNRYEPPNSPDAVVRPLAPSF